jgi:hypothetical protein
LSLEEHLQIGDHGLATALYYLFLSIFGFVFYLVVPGGLAFLSVKYLNSHFKDARPNHNQTNQAHDRSSYPYTSESHYDHESTSEDASPTDEEKASTEDDEQETHDANESAGKIEKSSCETEFSIRVVDQGGDGISGARINVHYSWMGIDDNGRTDEDGWIHFTKRRFLSECVEASISIDGEFQADESIEDGDSFSYTIDRD